MERPEYSGSPGSTITLTSGAATAVGKVRKLNEDSYLAGVGIVAVADGMGGHKAGEVASRITIEACAALASGEPISINAIEQLIVQANSLVREHALTHDALGMGTTLVGAALIDNAGEDSVLIFNVGDSRCYAIVDGGPLIQLTIDHSVVQEMVDSGEITAAEARLHAHRNVVTRAIGIEESVAADFLIAPQGQHVRLLLCSDGVSGEVSDVKISVLLREQTSPEKTAAAIIASVLEGLAKDNATAVVLDIFAKANTDLSVSELDEATGPRPSRFESVSLGVPASLSLDQLRSPGIDVVEPKPFPSLIDEVPL